MRQSILVILVVSLLLFSSNAFGKKKFEPDTIGKKKTEEVEKKEEKKKAEKKVKKKKAKKKVVKKAKKKKAVKVPEKVEKKTVKAPAEPRKSPAKEKKAVGGRDVEKVTRKPALPAKAIDEKKTLKSVEKKDKAPGERKVEAPVKSEEADKAAKKDKPSLGVEKKVSKVEEEKKGAVSENILFVGSVVDAVTGKPIVGAVIRTEVFPYPARSRKDGSFVYITKLKKGNHTVEISLAGYKKYNKQVNFTGEKSEIRFFLIPENAKGDSYSSIEQRVAKAAPAPVVKTKAVEKPAQKVTEKKEKPEKIEKVVEKKPVPEKEKAVTGKKEKIFGVDHIRNQAGIEALPPSRSHDSGLVISGSGTNAVYIGNHQFPILFHPVSGRSIVAAEELANVNLYRSGYSSDYLDSNGAVITGNFEARDVEGFRGRYDVALDSGSFTGYVGISKNDYLSFGIQSGYGGIYSKVLYDEKSFTLYPDYHDGFVFYRHRFSSRNEVKVYNIDAYYSTRVEENSSGKPLIMARGFQNGRSLFTQTVAEWKLSGDLFENSASIMFGTRADRYELTNDTEFAYNSYNVELADRFTYEINGNNILKAGIAIEGRFFNVEHEGFLPKNEGEFGSVKYKTGEDESEKALYPSLSLGYDFKWRELRVEPGVVYLPDPHNEKFGVDVLDPRVRLSYDLPVNVTLMGGAGLYSLRPKFYESFDKWGRKGLKPERALHVMGGGKWTSAEMIGIDASIFYRHLFNLIYRSADPEEGFENSGDGKIFGGNISVSVKRGKTSQVPSDIPFRGVW